MKYSIKTIAAVVLVFAIAILVAVTSSQKENAENEPIANHSKKNQQTKTSQKGTTFYPDDTTPPQPRSKRTHVAQTSEEAQAKAEAKRDASIAVMQGASTSYDPKELPTIRPYLQSSDPILRKAAVDAMIVLGDASAGPMLREAADKLDSQEEKEEMMAAADFVELPPVDLRAAADRLRRKAEEKEQR